MFDLPESYKMKKKIPQKDYLSMEFKPATRKKVKDTVISFHLTYQITGANMPPLVDESHNVQVVQFFDILVKDVKKSLFLAELFQDLMKAHCVLRIYDEENECFSFALKRLNLNDKTKVVVTDRLMTPIFLHRFPDHDERRYAEVLHFENIKATLNLQTYYRELFLRCYFLVNEAHHKPIAEWETLWYSPTKAMEVFELVKQLVDLGAKKKKSKEIGEQAKINMEIKKIKVEIEGKR